MPQVIYILFFLSGATGLVYEITWTRELVLVLGGTTAAVTAGVVSFMGGLALGSWLGGRAIDRSSRSPILVYGLLEGGVGLCALFTPFLIRSAGPVLAFGYEKLAAMPFLYSVLRFLICLFILLPPTMMMGATLPVLLRAALSSRADFGRESGRLYAVNTWGAVMGSALCGFALLPLLGNFRTNLVAAGTDFLILAAALFVARGFQAGALPESSATARKPFSFFRGRMGIILLGYGISGLAALLYQIAWTRSLTLTLGASTYSFSLILVCYIAGLAAGGALMTPFADKVRSPLLLAGIMEGVIALSALAVLPLLDDLNRAMFGWVADYQWKGATLSFIRFGVTLGVVAAPTLMMGMLFPLVARVAGRESEGVGEPLGVVYAVNTLGAIAGAFLSGYVLIDLLGVRGAIGVGSLLSMAAGAFFCLASSLPRAVRLAAASSLLLIWAAVIQALPSPDPLLINSGPYIYAQMVMERVKDPSEIPEFLHRTYRVLYFKEDAETTVSVLEERIERWRVLRINGKTDASTYKDMANQELLAHLPLLLHPRPRTVMVLGLASGVTAGSALLHPIQQLDCLELSPAVVEASRLFQEVSKLNYDDPRFSIILNDGRNHLAVSGKKYDVIISEPSNPWQAAMSALFTREFFELMKKSLNPGGIAVAWIDVYDMTVETFSLVLRTFAQVFPHVTLWESDPGGDYIMLGSESPFRISYSRLKQRCRSEKIAQDLERIQNGRELDILSRFVMDEKTIRKLAGPGPLHTDDRRQLEFIMPDQAFSPYQKRIISILEHFIYESGDISDLLIDSATAERAWLEKELQERKVLRLEYYRWLRNWLAGDKPSQANLGKSEDLLARLQGRYPSRNLARDMVEYIIFHIDKLAAEDDLEGRIKFYKKAHELQPSRSRAASIIASLELKRGRVEAAREWAEKALKINSRDPYALRVLLRLAWSSGDFSAAARALRRMVEVYPEDPELRVQLAEALFRQGLIKPALAQTEIALELSPSFPDALYLRGLLLFNLGRYEQAHKTLVRAIRALPSHPFREQAEKILKDAEKRAGKQVPH